MQEPCPFCAIAAGLDATVELVSEAPAWVAFFPDAPATIGHTLVIPRLHIRHLWEAEESLATELMAAAVKVGQTVISVVRPEGMNLITSAGVVAEQTVSHLHLHIVPRWNDDRIDPIWPRKAPGDRAELRDLARRIRSALQT